MECVYAQPIGISTREVFVENEASLDSHFLLWYGREVPVKEPSHTSTNTHNTSYGLDVLSPPGDGVRLFLNR